MPARKRKVDVMKNQSDANKPGWMRPPGACEYLGVSRRCLSDWQRKRLVPYVKIGRKVCLFRRADLDAALAKLTVKAV